MKVFALTLLSLLAVSQARLDYKLQCARNEIGIRWPSYHSNSEYFVCSGVYGNQLTAHCPSGEVFTFVLQQCTSPALYIPAPPMDVLPTAAPITMHLIEDSPPVIASAHSELENESAEHHHGHHHHDHEHEHEHEHESEEEVESHPTPPTPAPEPATPPTVEVSKPAVPVPNKVKKPVVPVPVKKPTVPVPNKLAKKPTAASAAAKKPAAPTPSKAAKKPSPPKPAGKKPASA